MISRRLALFGFATSSAVAAATAVTTAVVPAQKSKPAESREHFKSSLEYLLAMQAIGWTPLAMFQRLDDGSTRRMGVEETAPNREWVMETWGKFHAIQMRCPIQRAADLPQLDWWKEVWQFLYDRGLRQDVTLKRAIDAQLDDGGDA